MNADNFEERLLQELKGHVADRARDAAIGHRGGSRVMRPKRRPTWRLAGGGAAIAVGAAALVVMNSSATPGPASATGSGHTFHAQNAAFAIDAAPSGAVDITILKGSDKPDIGALRSDLAQAGVDAKVATDVPTCQALAQSPGAPSPVDSAHLRFVTDRLDYPFYRNGDLIYSVDASAEKTRGTTLWIMFSSTLSTIVVERTLDSGPQPDCLPASTS